MDSQKCYVYRQPKDRPAKRQKTEQTGLDSSTEIRKLAYRKAWTQQEALIEDIQEQLNQPLLVQYNAFVDDQATSTEGLRVGLISGNLTDTSTASVLQQLQRSMSDNKRVCLVHITSAEAPNLRAFLKGLIQKTTSAINDDEDETVASSARKLLNYDLEHLLEWCKLKGVKQIVVAFKDAEAFEVGVMSEILTLFNSWLDRITFKCLFGISTSVELFQARLPKTVLRYVKASLLSSPRDNVVSEKVFEHLANSRQTSLRVGSTLADAILQRQQDHLQSVEDLKQQLKYAHMSHYFANPLSVFLDDTPEVTIEHFEAVRNLPSFQKLAEAMLKEDDVAGVKELLTSDKKLKSVLAVQMELSRRHILWLTGACSTLKLIRDQMPAMAHVPFLAIYSRALRGSLAHSAILRETLLFLKKADATTLRSILPPIMDQLIVMPPIDTDVSPDDFRDLLDELSQAEDQVDSDENADAPRRGAPAKFERKPPNEPRRQSNENANGIATRLGELLQQYFDVAFRRADDILFHEILFYDLKSPHRDVFMPKPRAAIERALSAPQDYLGGSCSGPAQEGATADQPATAILYQLYLESGALINAFDLWSAFNNIVGARTRNERITMALFFRGLAELKYMGMIKQSGRRTDHLAKLLWKGL